MTTFCYTMTLVNVVLSYDEVAQQLVTHYARDGMLRERSREQRRLLTIRVGSPRGCPRRSVLRA